MRVGAVTKSFAYYYLNLKVKSYKAFYILIKDMQICIISTRNV